MSGIEHYHAPRGLEEAVRILADGDVTIFCGGTDLAPQTAAGQRQYGRTLMNIRRVADLSGITPSAGEIRIGALATVTDILGDARLRELAPVLVETADRFASDQIRNVASIGGNLCNASPAGDLAIPLLVLDAEVELTCWDAGGIVSRRVPLADFFTAPGRTVRRDNELLTAVVFATPAADFVAAFRKSGPRPALEIATVSMAIGARVDDGRLRNVRIALGAVAPTPRRARKLETTLEGRDLNPATIDEAAGSATLDAAPIDDLRASGWYRNHLLRVYTEELLQRVAENRN